MIKINKSKARVCFLLLSVLLAFSSAEIVLSDETTTITSWHELKNPVQLCKDKTVQYFEYKLPNSSIAHIVVSELKASRLILTPFVSESTSPTSKMASMNDAVVAVNGGFFNLNNGESTSYVFVDGKQVCDPKKNLALINNAKLKPYLETIFDRSEVRFLRDPKGHCLVQFAKHNQKLSPNTILLSSLQAGPMLLPRLTAKEEAFIRTDLDGKEFDSIGSNKTAARTAFGVTADDHIMLICVAGKGQDEYSSGITLLELAEFMRQLGCVKAINFDGGTSTTMVIHADSDKKSVEVNGYKTVCGRRPETRVKSVLMLKCQ